MRERNNRMTLRLNDKQYEKLNISAEKAGVPREVYLRMLIMGTTPKEKPTADFYNMTRELNVLTSRAFGCPNSPIWWRCPQYPEWKENFNARKKQQNDASAQ